MVSHSGRGVGVPVRPPLVPTTMTIRAMRNLVASSLGQVQVRLTTRCPSGAIVRRGVLAGGAVIRPLPSRGVVALAMLVPHANTATCKYYVAGPVSVLCRVARGAGRCGGLAKGMTGQPAHTVSARWGTAGRAAAGRLARPCMRHCVGAKIEVFRLGFLASLVASVVRVRAATGGFSRP